MQMILSWPLSKEVKDIRGKHPEFYLPTRCPSKMIDLYLFVLTHVGLLTLAKDLYAYTVMSNQ